MLQIKQVDGIAAEAGRAVLPAGSLVAAHTRQDIGAEGDERLWVTLVLRDQVIDGIDGDIALQTIDEVQHRLQAQGEKRSALVEFASESAFAADGGA